MIFNTEGDPERFTIMGSGHDGEWWICRLSAERITDKALAVIYSDDYMNEHLLECGQMYYVRVIPYAQYPQFSHLVVGIKAEMALAFTELLGGFGKRVIVPHHPIVTGSSEECNLLYVEDGVVCAETGDSSPEWYEESYILVLDSQHINLGF